jgi:hypothetical protein
MAGELRRIAVYVDEPKKGWFAWVLIEQATLGHWLEFQAAEEWVASYREAMAAGLLKLQSLIEDFEAGPRERDAPPASPKPPAGPFGFGSVLP